MNIKEFSKHFSKDDARRLSTAVQKMKKSGDKAKLGTIKTMLAKLANAEHDYENQGKLKLDKHETAYRYKQALSDLEMEAHGENDPAAIQTAKDAERHHAEMMKERAAKSEEARNIETGSRGGRYYISDSGEKVYVK